MAGHAVALLASLILGAGVARAAEVVDAVLAVVDEEVVAASDLALARALGLFGFAPSRAPIVADDVARYVRVALALGEARRLAIEVPPDAVASTWRVAETRAGGAAALDAWLAATGLDRAWANRAVEAHVVWRRFIELRFVALAFVTPDEVTAGLGAGRDDAEAWARVQDRLRDERARQALAGWLDERARAATIRTMLPPGAQIPLPFAPPATAPR